MDNIKIGYFADGPWSHETLKLLLIDETISVEFVVPRNDTTDRTLFELSKTNGLRYLENIHVNSDEFFELASSFNCDLFVSMSYNQIFRKRIINLPPLKVINCHAGKLPFYRGRNILNWALINNEKEFGITVHYVDSGIDTGNIILQKNYPISLSDDYSTLLIRSHTECANILYEAIKKIQNDTALSIDQTSIHPVGFYCGLRGLGDELINWEQTSIELFNFIRAICEPGPMATTYCNDELVKINRSKIIENAPSYKGTCGQLIGKTEEGYLVKTLDSFLEIKEVCTNKKLKVGDKLRCKKP
ncbi:MAG: methionyl-tRNA formyltransferase [Cyclobacteriaceae bacterium]|jgi:methionyl-tRNA formyltransferase